MRKLKHLVQIGLVGAIIAMSSPSAFAHAELISTNPAADSTIAAAPENIMLTFSEAPILAGSYIQVEQTASDFRSETNTVLEGTSLVIPWPEEIAPGQVKVNWRAVADDGHVANGSFEFTYKQEPVLATSQTTQTENNSGRNIAALASGIALLVLLIGIAATSRRKR
jgi:methionine-rich copper-binding protein CopC